MNNPIIVPPADIPPNEMTEKTSKLPCPSKTAERKPLPAVLASCPPIHYADPFDKLVNNDQLSYLPNLYLRQYKLIDELARIRHDFPEQKLLLTRPRTNWDTLIEDAKFASRIMQEVPLLLPSAAS